jgi:hypothetical protein
MKSADSQSPLLLRTKEAGVECGSMVDPIDLPTVKGIIGPHPSPYRRQMRVKHTHAFILVKLIDHCAT